MHVFHDHTANTAEIVLDTGESTTLTGVNRHQLVDALWKRGLVLGATSHWTPVGDRHRHGLDLAKEAAS